MPSEELQGEGAREVLRSCLLKNSVEQKKADESRKFSRYPRILAVTLDWISKPGKPILAEGLTRDISAGGIFAHSNRCPPVGTLVHYRVFLPAVHRMGANVRITGFGEIVRVERLGCGERWNGVAVRFEKQMIRVTHPRVGTGSKGGSEQPEAFERWLPKSRA